MFLIINATMMCTNIFMSCEIFFTKKDNTLNQALLSKASHISICYQGESKVRNALIQLQLSWLLDTHKKNLSELGTTPSPHSLKGRYPLNP